MGRLRKMRLGFVRKMKGLWRYVSVRATYTKPLKPALGERSASQTYSDWDQEEILCYMVLSYLTSPALEYFQEVWYPLCGPCMVLGLCLITLLVILPITLIYREINSNVPRLASLYDYSYVYIGEAAAFMIGWLIFGMSTLLQAQTAIYVSKMVLFHSEETIILRNLTTKSFVCLLLVPLILIDTKESYQLSKANVMIKIVMIAFTMERMDWNNWFIDVKDIPEDEMKARYDNTKWDRPFGYGLFPFGFTGMFNVGWNILSLFSGIDQIAFAASTLHNPEHYGKYMTHSIYLAVLFAIVFMTFYSFMVPYYKIMEPSSIYNMVKKEHCMFICVLFSLSTILGAAGSMGVTHYCGCNLLLNAMAEDHIVFESMRVGTGTRSLCSKIFSVGTSCIILYAFEDEAEIAKVTNVFGGVMRLCACCAMLMVRWGGATARVSGASDANTMNLDPADFQRGRKSLVTFMCLGLVASTTVLGISIRRLLVLSGWLKLLVIGVIVIAALTLLVCAFTIVSLPYKKPKEKYRVPLGAVLPMWIIVVSAFSITRYEYETAQLTAFIWLVIGFLIYLFFGMENKYKHLEGWLKKGPYILTPSELHRKKNFA